MPEGCPYVVGDTYARRNVPRFEFKSGATGYTGGGYPRVRSCERGPESGHGSNDVFVSIHRLIAVARCYPDDWTVAEIQEDMIGKDVHHKLGMPSANVPAELEVRDHGDHSGITQAQRRAWAEDAKRERQQTFDEPTCSASGCDAEVKAAVGGERYCLECATEHAGGETVEIV